METNLITKKELLEQTGISYGSLYRWKRMHLIPDEWFIHRSTFTGHETFFPREEILGRIQKILELRETCSLEELAEMFSPAGRPVCLSALEATQEGFVSRGSAEVYVALSEKNEGYDFEELTLLYLFDRLLQTGMLGQDEAFRACALCRGAETGVLRFYRKLGILFFFLSQDPDPQTDPDAVFVTEFSLETVRSELKQLLKRSGRE